MVKGLVDYDFDLSCWRNSKKAGVVGVLLKTGIVMMPQWFMKMMIQFWRNSLADVGSSHPGCEGEATAILICRVKLKCKRCRG